MHRNIIVFLFLFSASVLADELPPAVERSLDRFDSSVSQAMRDIKRAKESMLTALNSQRIAAVRRGDEDTTAVIDTLIAQIGEQTKNILASVKRPNLERDENKGPLMAKDEETDGPIIWDSHQSLRDEQTFKSDWHSGAYQIEPGGIRFVSGSSLTSRFQCLDKTRITVVLASTGRNFRIEFCNKQISLPSPKRGQGHEKIIIAVERVGKNLNYAISGDGKVSKRSVILLSDGEQNKANEFTLEWSKDWSVAGGEPLFKSLTVTGPVVFKESPLP